MDWINKLMQELPVIKGAPLAFVLAVFAALVVLAPLIWLVINWGYSTVITNQNSEIKLLDRQVKDFERQVDGLQKKSSSTHGNELAKVAFLDLQFHGDERTPTRLSFENVWRWYFLRLITIGIDKNTGAQQRQVEIGTLYITFDKPVEVGTIEVTSKDIKLPVFEVKEFTNRYAIIVFSKELPAGIVNVRVY